MKKSNKLNKTDNTPITEIETQEMDLAHDELKANDEYGADQISALEGLDAIRARPAMYVSSTSQKGVNQLCWEIIDNSVDEYVAGHGKEINFHIFKDCSVEISDSGRGIPVGVSDKFKDEHGKSMNVLTVVLTKIHAGGKFATGNYKASAGSYGVGQKAVVALSDDFVVKVKRDGHIYQQTFSKGKATSEVEIIGKTKETGTTIKYHPDATIFKSTIQPNSYDVKRRIAELASLNAGLQVNYKNDIDNEEITFLYEDGIIGYTKRLAENKNLLFDNPFYVRGEYTETDGNVIIVETSFIYDDESESNQVIKTFANNINTYEGGTHLAGFRNALKKGLNEFAIEKKLIKSPIELKYLLDGIYATISIKIMTPELDGQTKTKLGNTSAQDAVETVMNDFFNKITKGKNQFTAIFETIIDRATKVKEAEEAARRARAMRRTATKTSKLALPGQLADCANSTTGEYSEICLVEGNSAAGSAKEGRHPAFQAVLPLRGKVLNVEKASLDKMLNSPAIKTIIAAFGAGIGKTFNIDKLRYDKILIMCFTGDTKVKLLDGTTPTFEELVEMEKKNPGRTYWVYSKDEFGNFVPGKATNPRITRYTSDIVRLTLDNGAEVECTPDHLFLLKNNIYKEAKDLTAEDSLSTIYTKKYPYDREVFYDDKENKWTRTYYRVADTVYGKHDVTKWSRHYKDEDVTNNTPENLEWITVHDHVKHHNTFGKYNVSQKHRDTVKQMHKDGVYEHTYWGNNGYNGSQAQHDMLVKLNQRENIKQMKSNIITKYNHSEKNKETTAKLNQREDVKLLQSQGKVIHLVACMVRKGFTTIDTALDENNMKNNVVNVYKEKKILTLFDSLDELMQKAIDYEKTELTDDMFNKLTAAEEKQKIRLEAIKVSKRNQMAQIGKFVLEKGLELNSASYEAEKKLRKSRATKYDNFDKYFDSEEQFKEYAKLYNHKVFKKEFIHLDKPIPMYDLTVEAYHNFAIMASDYTDEKNICKQSTLVVHNCDADSDGLHIRSLLLTLFYNYMPGLIQGGYVYATVPPLYRVTYNGKQKYLKDDHELKEFRKRHKGQAFQLDRFKGLA